MRNRSLSQLFFLVDAWIPRYPHQISSEDRLVHRYYQFLCVIIAFFLAVFSVNSACLGLTRLAFGQALIVGVIQLSVLLYRRTQSVQAAVNLIMLLSAPLSFYRVSVTGGISSPILFGWPVISTLVLMTLTLRSAILWTIVHLAFAVFFYFVSISWISFPIVTPENGLANVRLAMICTVQFILYCSIYCIRKLNQEHRATMREQSSKITDLVRALSHDLSSPLMTLRHWLQTSIKRGHEKSHELKAIIEKIDKISNRISEVKEHEAQVAGKLTSVHTFEDQSSEEILRRKLLYYALKVLSIAAVSSGLYYFTMDFSKMSFLQGILLGGCMVSWWIYRLAKWDFIAGTILVTCGVLYAVSRAWILGGITSPAFLMWPIITLFAGLVLPLRSAAFWAATSAGVAIMYDLLNRAGYEIHSSLSSFQTAQIRIISILAVQLIVVYTIYFLKKENARFRNLIEKQGEKKAELLRTLTSEIGVPLDEARVILLGFSTEKLINNAIKAIQCSQDVIKSVETLELQTRSEAVTLIGETDLREIVREVLFLQQSAIQEKEIQWEAKFPSEDQPVIVAGERTGLTYQVLNNLISNAIKFTDKGGRISVNVEDKGDHCEISIRDSGIGIPGSLLVKLFDPRQQTSRAGTRGEKGTGFGMPIVKRFVEQYGGSLIVDSTTFEQDSKNHGTFVRIRLPKISPLHSEVAA